MKSRGWYAVFLILPVFIIALKGNLATTSNTTLERDINLPLEAGKPAKNISGTNGGNDAIVPVTHACELDESTEHHVFLANSSGDSEKLHYSHDGGPQNKVSRAAELPTLLEEDLAPSSSSSQPHLEDHNMKRSRTEGTDQSFGSHPLPSLEAFTPVEGARWVGYFHNEAVAAVLQTENGTMVHCVVQEVIQNREQCAARQYLGSVMPLVPLPLHTMVHLITLCGVLNSQTTTTEDLASTPDVNLWWMGPLTALQGILPGTLWCGKRDQATYYHQLGQRAQLDACCRAHDHCPVKLLPLQTRYGLTNFGFSTRSHCSCELEFFRCLKAVKDPLATTIGQLYFNVLKMECLNTVSNSNPASSPAPRSQLYTIPEESHGEEVERQPQPQTRQHGPSGTENQAVQEGVPKTTPRLECSIRDREGQCRMWHMNPRGFTERYVTQPLNLRF